MILQQAEVAIALWERYGRFTFAIVTAIYINIDLNYPPYGIVRLNFARGEKPDTGTNRVGCRLVKEPQSKTARDPLGIEIVTGMSEPGQSDASSSSEFPIFTGGPLYRLQQRIRVVRPGERRLGLAAL